MPHHTYAVCAELHPVSPTLLNSSPREVTSSTSTSSFHTGLPVAGGTAHAFGWTFTRLFSAAIIELEYVFARMSPATW